MFILSVQEEILTTTARNFSRFFIFPDYYSSLSCIDKTDRWYKWLWTTHIRLQESYPPHNLNHLYLDWRYMKIFVLPHFEQFLLYLCKYSNTTCILLKKIFITLLQILTYEKLFDVSKYVLLILQSHLNSQISAIFIYTVEKLYQIFTVLFLFHFHYKDLFSQALAMFSHT